MLGAGRDSARGSERTEGTEREGEVKDRELLPPRERGISPMVEREGVRGAVTREETSGLGLETRLM